MKQTFLLVPSAFILVAALSQATSLAQTPTASPPEEPIAAEILPPDWPHSKQLAKAKWEAAHAPESSIAKAKLEAARRENEGDMKQFLAGKGTLDFLLASASRVLESELAVSKSEQDLIAAYERYLDQARQIERIHELRYEAARISVEDYLESKYARLEGQIALAKAGAKKEKNLPFQGTSFDALLDILEGLSAKDLAKSKFGAAHDKVEDLLRAKLTAARGMIETRSRQFQAGKGTLDLALAASSQVRDSELALAQGPIERRAALERYWNDVRLADKINQARYESGRISEEDYLETRWLFLDALIVLAKFRKANMGRYTFASLGYLESFESETDLLWHFKDLAKDKLEAVQANLEDLTRAKRDAARREYAAREGQFLAGRETLSYLIASSLRLLKAEQDETENQSNNLRAIESHWSCMKLCEIVNEERFRRGRIAAEDYFQTRYFRLDAEALLAHSRIKKGQ